VTIRDAFSGTGSSFLGTVSIVGDLPGTVADAKITWPDLTVDPVIGDTAFVGDDSSHGNSPSQYVIGNISGDDDSITWKYQFSIPTAGFELSVNKSANLVDPDNVKYPTVKAVTDALSLIRGLPSGGSTSQVLSKVNGDDFNVHWVNGFTGISSTDFLVGGDDYNRTINIKSGGIVTGQLADGSVSTVKVADGSITTLKLDDSSVTSDKLASDSVISVKIADANITTPKLADSSVTSDKLASDSVSTVKIVNDAVTTVKINDKNVTPAKLSVGGANQILKTNSDADAVLWDDEQDISGKANKFDYTPSEGTLTIYDLDDIQTFNIEGNGAGVNPNTGIVYTNFAGEETSIEIDGLPGFFNYKGEVKTFERLPEVDAAGLSNGDLYSIYGPIVFKGAVDAMEDLYPNSSMSEPDDLDQYYVTDEKNYQYWSADSSEPDGGMWVINHCQSETGCDNTGYYIFGVGESNAHWNRLDSELNVDQVLNVDSVNAVANKPVTVAINERLLEEDFIDSVNYCLDNIFPTPVTGE
jgi:hypothetical protein